ncbi:MAG TPA: CRISPR-associated protein Cas4 [Methanomassiliicoccales archaeon]|nr:CRISPR-associated protein Cas4 [Methanomassiliicoccales archaeon]
MVESIISASELERYCYCPLSWWLSREQEMVSEKLQEGERRHEDFNTSLRTIVESEKRARTWERIVLWFSMVATILAMIGIFIFNANMSRDLIWLSSLPSILWIAVILMLVFRLGRTEKGQVFKIERALALSSIIIVFLVLNGIIIYDVPADLAKICMVLSLFWLIGTSVALYQTLSASQAADIKRKEAHLSGQITYIGNEEAPLLRSERYHLSGRPDFILEEGDEIVPVELKSGRQPSGPFFSHIVQVAAYCLLLSETQDKKVSRGVLKYGDQEFEIDYDEDLRDLVIGKLEEMRDSVRVGETHRNHNRPGKCQSCSRREVCPEKLA